MSLIIKPLQKKNIDHLLNDINFIKFFDVPTGSTVDDALFKSSEFNIWYQIVGNNKFQSKDMLGIVRVKDIDLFARNSTIQIMIIDSLEKESITDVFKESFTMIKMLLFLKMNLEKITISINQDSIKEIKALKELGCEIDGIRRSSLYTDAGMRSEVVFSIFKDEYDI